MNLHEVIRARQTALWNALIPKRAIRFDFDSVPGHVRYLHPTKGWREVSRKRLGLT